MCTRLFGLQQLESVFACREPRNVHDRRAVAVPTSEDTLVGHAPREISKIFWHFKNRCLLLPENQERDGCLKVYRCLKVKGA